MECRKQLMRLIVAAMLVLGLVCGGLGSQAAAQGEEDLPGRIQQQYEQLQGFETDFVQVLTNASSGEQETRRGTIAFEQPRSIRWETTSLEQELLIVGPEAVWDYFPAEEVAYTYAPQQVFQSKTMLRFISGEANITEDFRIERQKSDTNWSKLKLIPKQPEPNLVLAYIWVEPESALLRQVLLVDFFGNGNKLTFKDIKLDPEFAPGWFEFEPPDGVEVLRNTTPGQGGVDIGS